MVDVDRIKEKAWATAGTIADRSVGFAKMAGDKAKEFGRLVKLKTEIAMEKDSLRKSFAELGKRYYEKHKNSPDPELAQITQEIEMALNAVAKKQQEIDMLKKQLSEDDLNKMAAEETKCDIVDDAIEKAAPNEEL